MGKFGVVLFGASFIFLLSVFGSCKPFSPVDTGSPQIQSYTDNSGVKYVVGKALPEPSARPTTEPTPEDTTTPDTTDNTDTTTDPTTDECDPDTDPNCEVTN